ncbi:antitoxin Xre/MbcA/ParS toxin-binding domain-containing protein [Salsipaludibacter albus]|uniref:antitoxin Xre/MbcA/ParS toxin-binding domain-containing protein n=1 Tax=Salsipaludibacter albus TaxID=2849650 RepID=UPI001EE3AE2E|nr:hypothetical protein [Salsipaludibacter albus]MBY5161639.1 DUF2384 domain-containing protein [Salsipaludibacter albus]
MDDELELRALVGDEPVDDLGDDRAALETGLDVLRLLQGWVDDDQAAAWLGQPARRLDGRSPLQALAEGDHDDVVDACRAFIAAQG